MKDKLSIEIFENVSDGVYVLDRDRKILFWNRKAEEMTGYTKSDVIGKRCQDNILKHIDEKGNELCLGSCPLVKAMEEKEVKEAKVFLHHKEGYRVPVFVIGIPVFDEKGEVIGAVEIFRENFKERDFEEEIRKLRELAFIDELTKVLNRRGLEYYLRMKLREAKRRKRTIGILFVDVDDFKRINDDFGYVVGDEVLRFVAMTIRKNIRMGDVVARYGGDEFVVIVDLDEERWNGCWRKGKARGDLEARGRAHVREQKKGRKRLHHLVNTTSRHAKSGLPPAFRSDALFSPWNVVPVDRVETERDAIPPGDPRHGPLGRRFDRLGEDVSLEALIVFGVRSLREIHKEDHAVAEVALLTDVTRSLHPGDVVLRVLQDHVAQAVPLPFHLDVTCPVLEEHQCPFPTVPVHLPHGTVRSDDVDFADVAGE